VFAVPTASDPCPDDCSEIITLWFEDNFRTCKEGDGFTGFPDSALPGLHQFYRKCRAIYSIHLPSGKHDLMPCDLCLLTRF